MEELADYHQSDLLYTEESILRYRDGGFHPVCLGDTFHNDRYEIHHKLGWGGFSTVWLAEDRQRKRWVSIKIMTADATMKSSESSILRSLAKICEGSLSSEFIVQLLDEFTHKGPNGIHQCLVFELLGPTVHRFVSDYYDIYDDPEDRIEPEIILKISEQLLKAIAFIHEAGFVHGDISSRNIAFTCSHLARATKEDLFAILGSPEPVELIRLDGKPLNRSLPKQLIETASWNDWIDEDEEDLRLIDFGETFMQGTEPREIAQPPTLRAPETIFTANVDYRLDLWRAGIVIYMCVVRGFPFHYWGNMDALVAHMIYVVGKFPAEWQQMWDEMQRASKFVPIENPSPLSLLEQRFNDKVSEESLKPLLPVIQGLMKFLPSDRISVSHALDLVRVSQQMWAYKESLMT